MTALTVDIQHKPTLAPGFMPAVLWNRAFRRRVAESDGVDVAIALPTM